MALPKAFEERMQELLKSEYAAFCAAFSEPEHFAGVRIVNGEARDRVLDALSDAEQVSWCPDGFYVDKAQFSGNHPYHVAGLVYFQEPSAMAVVEALGIEAGDYVLDLCAAPGGKAVQAGAKLSGTGLLVANEIVPKRAAILAENIERCGIGNSVIFNEDPERLAEKYPEFFDKIIVDAPCSGEGMFRKEPQAAEQWSIAHTEACALRQKKILDSAIRMLRPGGRLIYSTCTFSPCENEGVAAYLLDTYPDLALMPIRQDALSDGCGAWAGTSHDMTLTKRIFPHRQKGEGHFMALFQKSGEASPRPERQPQQPLKEAMELYRGFERAFLNCRLAGAFRLFGENLYLVPKNLDYDKILVKRAGLHLGVCKKGRFEPGHALLRTLKVQDVKNAQDYCVESEELQKYLHGETIPSEHTGWTAVFVDGFPVGWGKASGGVLKNHYPKYLRLK